MCFAAHQNTEVVGLIALQHVHESADILEFVVDHACRRQGIGIALYKYAEYFLKTKNSKEIWLEVSEKNTPALCFYREQNFRPQGLRKNYYNTPQGSVNAILMNKKISPM